MKQFKGPKYQRGIICATVIYKGTIGPLVSALAQSVTNSTIASAVSVGLKFDTDGEEYQYLAAGAFGSTVGTWLDQGTSDQVWVEFLRNGGTQTKWDNRNNSQRYNINVDINFLIVDTNQNGVAETIQGQFRFWDAASGGNTLQTTTPNRMWSANALVDPCPLCCFTPWTLVSMADGSQREIVDVLAGDLIKVESGIEQVTEVLVRENRPMNLVKFADDRILEVSEDHPLYVDGKGYAAVNPVIEYKDLGIAEVLAVGDKVLDEFGNLNEIVSIEGMDYPDTVYTFENSKFYANGMLVY